jgi:hypothetical protein
MAEKEEELEWEIELEDDEDDYLYEESFLLEEEE